MYIVVGAVLLVVGGAVGLLYYLSMAGSAPIAAISVAPTVMVAKPKVSERVDQPNRRVLSQSLLVSLLEKYLEATQLSEVKSLIVNGTASTANLTCELVAMARCPNLYTLKTEGVSFKYTSAFGYNGKQGWLKTDLLNFNEDKVEFFMRVALFESSLVHLAWSYYAHESLDYRLDSVLGVCLMSNGKGAFVRWS